MPHAPMPEELVTGIDVLDRDHQYLFNKIAEFLVELPRHGDHAYLKRVLGFLDQYSASHFAREQELMDRLAYPERLRHAAAHISYRDEVAMLIDEADTYGPLDPLLQRCRTVLADLLIRHIREHDIPMADFLRHQGFGTER